MNTLDASPGGFSFIPKSFPGAGEGAEVTKLLSLMCWPGLGPASPTVPPLLTALTCSSTEDRRYASGAPHSS